MVISRTVVASKGMVVVGHVCHIVKLPSTTILGIMGQRRWYWVPWVTLDLVELDHVVVQMLLATTVVSMATSSVIVGQCKGSSSSRMVVHVVVHPVDVVVVVEDHLTTLVVNMLMTMKQVAVDCPLKRGKIRR